MSEKSRIEKVILHHNMTSGQFAAEIGVQNSTLSHILNNRNNPSLDVLKKILSRFPDISTDWLILGQGSMLRQEKQSKELTLFDSLEETTLQSTTLMAENTQKISPPSASIQNEVLKTELYTSTDRPLSPVREQTSAVGPTAMFTEPVTSSNSQQLPPPVAEPHSGNSVVSDRKVSKVILYFTDNTFQEFESK